MRQERWTDRTRRVIHLAGETARRWRNNFIGTEHLLLGLIQEQRGMKAQVLEQLKADAKEVKRRVERLMQKGKAEPPAGNLPFTPRAESALNEADKEADALGDNQVGVEHLLLGLLAEGEGIAATVLEELKLNTKLARDRVKMLMTGLAKGEAAGAAGDEELRKELARFWRQFGLLLSSGVPVLQTLEIIKCDMAVPDLKAAVAEIVAAIRNGATVSKAMAARPALFSAQAVAMVHAGECGGVLDVVCGRIAAGLESRAFPVSSPPDAIQDVYRDEKQPAEGLDIVRYVDQMVLDAVRARASDIHLEPLEGKGQVRLRVDGCMQTPVVLERTLYESVLSRLMIMSRMDLAEKRRPQDGRIVLTVEGHKLDLRVSAAPYLFGYSAVVRILIAAAAQLTLDQVIKESPRDLATLKSWAHQPNGLYFIAGPTGSGKTTLLYALLKEATTPERKIVSAENPVEYVIENVLQAEVRGQLTFAMLLRSFLRQDPDVIMVGEIRDRETLELMPAVTMTGHLVFSTLHTETATAAPRRMMDIGLEPWLISETLKGVAGIRLVRKVCPACKTRDRPEGLEAFAAGLPDAEQLRRAEYARGKGCDQCRGTGYRGRMAIFEIFTVTPEIRSCIARGPTAAEVRREAVRGGMTTMRHDGLQKAAQGLTTVDEVLRVTMGMD